jgi:hypothetical protein
MAPPFIARRPITDTPSSYFPLPLTSRKYFCSNNPDTVRHVGCVSGTVLAG